MALRELPLPMAVIRHRQTMKRIVPIVLALGVLAAALLWWRGRGREAQRIVLVSVADAGAGAGEPAAGRRAEHAAGPSGLGARADGAAAPGALAGAGKRHGLTAADRARIEAALAAARSRREAAAPPVAAPVRTAAATTLAIEDKTGDSSEWERRQLATVNELLGECYDLGRVEDPALAGDVMLVFTIRGEPELGGLVSDVAFDERGTTIAQATMRECMSEALYALELDPPPDGVTVARQLTLKLTP